MQYSNHRNKMKHKALLVLFTLICLTTYLQASEHQSIKESRSNSLKELQEENNKQYRSSGIAPGQILKNGPIRVSPHVGAVAGPMRSPILEQGNGDYLGNSRWDRDSYNYDEWQAMQQNPNEFREQDKWTPALCIAGLFLLLSLIFGMLFRLSKKKSQ